MDTLTLGLGPGHAPPEHDICDSNELAAHVEDVDHDGYDDLLVHFRIPESGIAFGDLEACVSAATTGGDELRGCDAITTVGMVNLSGAARGGEVTLAIDGLTVTILTTAGESAGAVANRLAAAVNDDARFGELGISAQARGSAIEITGTPQLASVATTDPGLFDGAPLAVPTLSPFGVGTTAVLLLTTGTWLSGRRRRRPGREAATGRLAS